MSHTEGSDRAKDYTIHKYTPRHPAFPYSHEDLTPTDTAAASAFYTSPRIVTHIDGPAITALREYYARYLLPVAPEPTSTSTPQQPSRVPRILDLCTSHISHLPTSLEALVSDRKLWVCGIGMNAAEMRRNAMLRGGWAVQDLDAAPRPLARLVDSQAFDRGQVAGEETSASQQHKLAEASKLDATTCVVSVDYLRRPVAVLAAIRAQTRVGGSVHLVVSNRCFPSKAVRRWLRVDEQERLQMCGDYLWWSGWRDVEIVTLKDGLAGPEDGVGADDTGGGAGGGGRLAQLMRGLGVAGMGSDPLWVVRGRNTGEEHDEDAGAHA